MNEKNKKKYLIKTITIELPDKLINPDKNKIIDTLTKKGNIKRVEKQLVINIHTDPNRDKPYIKDGIKGEIKEKEKKPRKKNEHIKTLSIEEYPKSSESPEESEEDVVASSFSKDMNVPREYILCNLRQTSLPFFS